MATFLRPEHVVISLTTKLKGVLQTPTTAVITIKDPSGNTVTGVDEAAFTIDSSGRLHYNYDTNLDPDDEDYSFLIKTTYATLISISTGSFRVDTP